MTLLQIAYVEMGLSASITFVCMTELYQAVMCIELQFCIQVLYE